MRPRLLLALAFLLALATPAVADEPTPGEWRQVGLGYKLGNGIGFFGGDAIVCPFPHLCGDLQGAFLRIATDSETAYGFGLAPELQLQLFVGHHGTPYVGAGVNYAHIILGDATGEAFGVFANVGYVYTFSFGLGLEVGVGGGYLSQAKATSATSEVTMGGKAYFNIEAGLRYMIF